MYYLDNREDAIFKISYQGKNIYAALKEAVDWNTWAALLQRNDFSWINILPVEDPACEQYFTVNGYEEFMRRTIPLIVQMIDESDLEISKHSKALVLNDHDIIYEDEHQIVVS